MEGKLLKSSYEKIYRNLKSLNGNLVSFIDDSYFVNLDIVNVNRKGAAENDKVEQPRRFEFSSSNHRHPLGDKRKNLNLHEEYVEDYLETTVKRLSRRDRVPTTENSSTGTLTTPTAILNNSIQRVLVYGSPGTGKTTLCLKIVHDFYEKNIWNHFDEIVWLQLRRLKDEKFVQDDLNEEHLLRKYFNLESFNLNLGKVLFILDGWDEIQDLLQDPSKSKLAETIQKMKSRENVIVTSRPYVKLNFEDYERVLEITGFNEINIREYIQAVLKHNTSIRANEEDAILKYINNTVLSELVGIPILLEIFLYTWREIFQVDIEEITITKLYEILVKKLSDNFLKGQQTEMGLREIVKDANSNLFKFLIQMAKKWLEDGTIQFPCSEFDCTPEEKFQLQQLPFLSGVSEENWKEERCELIHLTFLEFFAALALINRNEEEFRLFVVENKFNPKYFVVFTFIAGLTNGDFHNLIVSSEGNAEYNLRLSKEEKLELFFDYLEEDPIDLSGKYIFTLLTSCMEECELQELRARIIWYNLVSLGTQTEYENGFDGGRIMTALRSLSKTFVDEWIKSDKKQNYWIFNKKTFAQLTDDQVNTLVNNKPLNNIGKLEILCRQKKISQISVDAIVKLMNSSFLEYFRDVFTSNLPMKILEKILRLILVRNIYHSDSLEQYDFKFNGISESDVRKLCERMSKNIQPQYSMKEVITELITSPDFCRHSMIMLKDNYEFHGTLPEALVDLLAKNPDDNNIQERVTEILLLFDVKYTACSEQVLRICKNTSASSKLRYSAMSALGKMYRGEEIPSEVSTELLGTLKRCIKYENERLSIRNRLLRDYFLNEYQKKKYYFELGLLRTSEVPTKEFLDGVKTRVSTEAFGHLLEIILDGGETEFANESLQEYEQHLLVIAKFIAKSKTTEGNLYLQNCIADFIKSRDATASLSHLFGIVHLDLIHKSVEDILENLINDFDDEPSDDWKWNFNRVLHLLFESQRYAKRNHYETPAKYRKHVNINCMTHEKLVSLKYVKTMLGSEKEQINGEDGGTGRTNDKEILKRALEYISSKRTYGENRLWEELTDCGLEDSQYQENVVSLLVEIYTQQELEREMKDNILEILSNKKRLLSKKQLSEILKVDHVGLLTPAEVVEDGKNFESGYRLETLRDSEQNFRSICKYTKKLNCFSEEEVLDLRKMSKSLDFFCQKFDDEEYNIDLLLKKFSAQVLQTIEHDTFGIMSKYFAGYLKSKDHDDIYTQLQNYDLTSCAYYLKIQSQRAKMYFSENIQISFVAPYVCCSNNEIDFVTFHKTLKKLRKEKFSQDLTNQLFQKLKEDAFGFFFLNILETNESVEVPMIVDYLGGNSTTTIQRECATYILSQKLIQMDDNLPLYIVNNCLYIGSSAHDKPARSNLNAVQVKCLMDANAKQKNYGLNIRAHGIGKNVESFRISLEKCSINDLSEREEILKAKTHLDMSFQNISQLKDMEKIYNFVCKYPVETLVLSGNKITTEMFEFILENVAKTSIGHLILNDNIIDVDKINVTKFFGEGESSIRDCKLLKLVDLSGNLISAKGCQMFEQLVGVETSYRKDSRGKVILKLIRVNHCTILYKKE